MKQALLSLLKDKVGAAVGIVFIGGVAFVWLSGATNIRHLAVDLLAAYFLFWGLIALVSKTPREELQKRFLLMTVTILCVLGLDEVPALVGAINYRHVFPVPYSYEWEEPGRIFDEELLWLSEPHYRVHVKYTKGNIGTLLCLPPGPVREYDLRYDQNGFRNEVDLETADIVVIGDSYIEAPMVPTEVLMTSLLEKLQGKTVANLGMAGYGPQQELAVLKRYVPQLHPKTVVWVFFGGNDLSDAHHYEYLADLSNRQTFTQVFWSRSFSRNVLSALLHLSQGCRPHPDAVNNYGIIREDKDKKRRIYFLGTHSNLSPLDAEALETTRSTIATAYQLSRERGIHLVVVYAPDATSVYLGLSNLIEVSDDVKKWELSDLPVRLRAMVADISPDIDYLDLTPVFKFAAEKGTLVFLPDDTHWTPEGHRIAAEALSELLSSHPPERSSREITNKKKDISATVRLPR